MSFRFTLMRTQELLCLYLINSIEYVKILSEFACTTLILHLVDLADPRFTRCPKRSERARPSACLEGTPFDLSPFDSRFTDPAALFSVFLPVDRSLFTVDPVPSWEASLCPERKRLGAVYEVDLALPASLSFTLASKPYIVSFYPFLRSGDFVSCLVCGA